MKFGKLTSIDGVDFSLPPDPPFSTSVLTENQAERGGKATRCYIGCTGWSMKEWVGTVYPKNTRTTDYLQAYAKQFNTIELNTTHYRIPDQQLTDRWLRETPDDFRFCPKVPQVISHSKQMGIGSEALARFALAMERLLPKLGYCFLQLPPYFGHDRLNLLEQFLRGWPRHIPLALEARHESWFGSTKNTLDLAQLLATYQCATVLTDVAGRRDVLHMYLTMPVVLVRFVGNGLHPTDYTRLDAWTKRLQKWSEQGLHTIYFFPHEPDNILAPQISAYLTEIIKKHTSFAVRGPQLMDDNSGEQMSLF